MIEDSRSGIDGRQATLVETATQPLERRRSQFSFLTWPFFLAQVFVAEQFLGDGVRLALAGEEPGKSASSENSDSGFETLPLKPRHRSSNVDDGEATAGIGTRANLSDDRLQLSKIAATPPEGESGERANGKEADVAGDGDSSESGDAQKAVAADVESIGSSAATGMIHDAVGSDVATEGSGSAPVLSASNGVVLTQLDGGTLLTIETPSLIGDVAAVAAPIVQTAASVLPAATDTVAGVTADVLGAAAPIAQVANPVLATATDAIAELSGNVFDAAPSIVQAIVQAGTPLLTPAIDAVAHLSDDAFGTVTPIVQAASPLLTTAVDVVADLAGDALHTTAFDAAHAALAAATNTVTDVAGDVLGTVTPAVEATAPLLTATTDPIAALAGDALRTAAPIIDAAAPTLAAVTNTVTDVAGDVLGTITPAVEATAPLLTAPTDLIADLAGDALRTAAPIIDAAAATLAAVTHTVANAIGDLSGIVTSDVQVAGADSTESAPGAASILDPVMGTVADAVGHAVDGHAIGDVPDAPAPAAHSADAVLASASDMGGDLLGASRLIDGGGPASSSLRLPVSTDIVVDTVSKASPLQHGLTDGGVISIDTEQTAALGNDELYGDGGYSQLGVAMSTGAPDVADGVGHDAGRASSGTEDLLPAHDHGQVPQPGRELVDHEHPDALAGAATPVVVHVASALDDIGLRAHDGLL